MNMSFEVTESCFRIMLSLALGATQLERVVKVQQASHMVVWFGSPELLLLFTF